MSEKMQIEISLVLPSVPDKRGACIQRFVNMLESKEGIESTHIRGTVEKGADQFCIHFNPQELSVGEVRKLAIRAGAELERRFGYLVLKIDPIHIRQARSLELEAMRINGVLEAAVSPVGLVRIEFDRRTIDEKSIQSELRNVGVLSIKDSDSAIPSEPVGAEPIVANETGDNEHGGAFGERTELIFAAICGVLLLAGWITSELRTASPWAPLSLYLTAFFVGGFFTFRDAFKSIRAFRLEIDLLMLVAAIGAATLGEWAEGALLLFLFSLGHALEHYAMGRAKRAIEALAKLAPPSALVRRDGQTADVPVELLRLGDIVIVKPNERIPADGFVLKGQSSVNQAPITGESVPVDKRAVGDSQEAAADPDRLGPEHRTFVGTINGGGALEIQVTKLSSESTLARVVKMVNEAQTLKSPTQRFTDKFERGFVPAVLVFAVLLLFSCTIVDETFRDSFYRCMAVLVAASPCALAISTPSAVLSGVARAARGGVLVKGGGPLENLGRLSAIGFDKTGTLTEGKPRLTDAIAASGRSKEELLRVAMAVEKLSDHPLAAAVVQGGKERLKGDSDLQAQDVQSITGRGVKATVGSMPVYIGNDRLFGEIGGPPIPDELSKYTNDLKSSGRTTMIVRHGDTYLGVLGLMDTPRNDAKVVISRLRQLGVKRMIMLSGDNQQVADAVARQVGIDEALGDLMPDDKVEAIKKLSQEGGVAMVGDGVNDAPAMASATVGIAMGAAGSEVALETADVALMSDDLNHLPFAVGLSRQAGRVIRQNLWISLGMVVFLIPATVLGLHIGAAVLFHEGSTLFVVFNALRLLNYRDV